MTPHKNKQTESEVKAEKANKILSGVKKWTAFYRANPHRFARDYLGLSLKPFQQIILCMMFAFVNLIYLASRGGGKSYLMAIFCCCYCILYPGTTICIASGTRGQAKEVIDKINNDLRINCTNLALEIETIKATPSDSFVEFKNGSRIVVVTANHNSRHNRATVLLIDEFRMVDKATIDTVLRKFLTSERHPKFLNKPEYKNYPKERTKQLYASSCWFEQHWSYELVRTYVVNMIRGRGYFCCSMPYQIAVKEGLLNIETVEDEMSESTFDAISFQMEMEALFFGQSSSGLYDYDVLNRNRKLDLPIYPKREYKIADKKMVIPPKEKGEYRILSADIALMSSTKHKNDATAIFVNFMKPTETGRYLKNIVFTENYEGLRTDAQALVIRKLFDDYDCDYLVIDAQGLGLGVIDALMNNMEDPETGKLYPPLSCYNNEEMASRCTDPDAPKVIWAIKGNSEFNSQCALTLREEFKQNLVKLLKSEYDADELLSKGLKGYNSLAPSDQLELKLPYIHTTLLINELVKLEYENRDKVIKVKEKSGMRKDRYSSLSYNIYVAKAIEREEVLKNSAKSLETLVLEFKAPKLRK